MVVHSRALFHARSVHPVAAVVFGQVELFVSFFDVHVKTFRQRATVNADADAEGDDDIFMNKGRFSHSVTEPLRHAPAFRRAGVRHKDEKFFAAPSKYAVTGTNVHRHNLRHVA